MIFFPSLGSPLVTRFLAPPTHPVLFPREKNDTVDAEQALTSKRMREAVYSEAQMSDSSLGARFQVAQIACSPVKGLSKLL